MSCCGEKRAQLTKKTETSQALEQKERTSSRHQPTGDTPAYFQYVGKKGLTVIGRETHRLYRFDKPGAVVAIDKRDQRAMEAVPVLRLVRRITS